MTRFGTKALDRFLSPHEQSLVTSPTRAAGFWAAKEAASKALKTGIGKECSFADILLDKLPNGAPTISFAPHLIERFGIVDADLSITHDGGMAIAVVVVETKK